MLSCSIIGLIIKREDQMIFVGEGVRDGVNEGVSEGVMASLCLICSVMI